MSANLAIQLSERTFAALSHEASTAGKTPAELAAAAVERAYGAPRGESAHTESARERFERFFGSVDFGQPVGVANESIDEDLAREYGFGAETA